jgi:sugar/nucleoside kinase (ribokinase family)
VDISGLAVDGHRDSFFWRGRYEGDMNSAQTVDVKLNVLGDFTPTLPDSYRKAPYLFLANSHPLSQAHALSQMTGEPFVCCDSMNLWIETQRKALVELLGKVTGFFCNDGEARMLGGSTNLIQSGRRLLDVCSGFLVIKKGEHGAILFHRDGLCGVPAFPAGEVVDPTGAGDTFAGGLMGSLAGRKGRDAKAIREALIDGTVMASFAVEGFGLERLAGLTGEEMAARRRQLMEFLPEH